MQMLNIAQHPRVAVAIINWRQPAMTLSAVESVLGQSYEVKTILVVDNGSGDGSPALLKNGLSSFGSKTTLLNNKTNLGFGGGCNRALREILIADYDFVWLLNNDADPARDCLQALILKMQSFDKTPGIVGSWLIDPDEHHEGHYGSWMHPLTMACGNVTDESQLQYSYSWVTAASMLVSVPALKEVGLFDERFFMYWEDADLNMRMREKGFEIAGAQDAIVYHSAGTSSIKSPISRYVWHFQSQRIWLTKHHSHPRFSRLLLTVKYFMKSLLDLDFGRLRALIKVLFTAEQH